MFKKKLFIHCGIINMLWGKSNILCKTYSCFIYTRTHNHPAIHPLSHNGHRMFASQTGPLSSRHSSISVVEISPYRHREGALPCMDSALQQTPLLQVPCKVQISDFWGLLHSLMSEIALVKTIFLSCKAQISPFSNI